MKRVSAAVAFVFGVVCVVGSLARADRGDDSREAAPPAPATYKHVATSDVLQVMFADHDDHDDDSDATVPFADNKKKPPAKKGVASKHNCRKAAGDKDCHNKGEHCVPGKGAGCSARGVTARATASSVGPWARSTRSSSLRCPGN